jgi:ribulose-phosphate 3-epimerase
MTVNPGFGGQKFITSMLPKIAQLNALIGNRPIDLQIDGGVTAENAGAAAKAGANSLVAGSSIYKAGNLEGYRTNVEAIRKAAEQGRA